MDSIASDLALLDAEMVGFDPMDLVKALPGVLKDTGQIVKVQEDAKKAAAQQGKGGKASSPATPAQPAPAPAALGLPWWKIGGAAAAGGLLVFLLRR